MSEFLQRWGEGGKVAVVKIPKLYRLSFGRGIPSFPGLRVPGVSGSGSVAARPSTGLPTGLRWFERMDKNGDGDLSPREFLGTRDRFRKLDRNGDGLIDAVEASTVQDKRK